MGRRKIEIVPISHERNRSVTFLKRKNGLFKKAYELGVLCSVDVAVIIFEDRPGHNQKLYQYCSSNIHDIVQKHVRYDGESDTRGPSDFSGHTGGKLDDIGEGDDDDIDDEDGDFRGGHKRRVDGKTKQSSDFSLDPDDYFPNRIAAIPPPPMNIPGMHSSTSSSLPVSSDRHSHAHHSSHKRPRVAPHMIDTHSRSSEDDGHPNPPSSGGGGNSYHPSQSPSANYRQQYLPHSGPSPHYTGFYPVSTDTPPPAFVPLQSDFTPATSSSSEARHGVSMPSGRGAASGGYPQRSSSSYEQNMYQPMTRQNHPPSQHGGGPSGTDILSTFLNPGEQRQAHTHAHPHHPYQPVHPSNPNFASLDWPNHGGTQGTHAHSSAGSGSSALPSATPSSASSTDPPNWLDFLSSANNPQPGSAPQGGVANVGRESVSWERGGERQAMFDGRRGVGERPRMSPDTMISPGGGVPMNGGGARVEDVKKEVKELG